MMFTFKYPLIQPCSDENDIGQNRELNQESGGGTCIECQLIEMGEMVTYSGICKTCGKSPSVREWSTRTQ